LLCFLFPVITEISKWEVFPCALIIMEMNFTLIYDGVLHPTTKDSKLVEHKQEIRRVFHRQLFEFWKGTPFEELRSPSNSLTKEIGEFCFFPLVTCARREIAELQITMLRPEQGPGSIVFQGGDIDNRLKTLFDSLRMPGIKKEISPDDKPGENETPFYCLLEDDILITKLSISTDRLLEPCDSDSYVKLIVHVKIKQLPQIGANMVLRLG